MDNTPQQSPSAAPPPAAQSAMAAFAEGLLAPWIGLRYMLAHPRLWRYGAIPLVLNLLICAVLLAALVAATAYFVVVLHPRFADGWGWMLLEVLLVLLLLALALGLTAIAWVVLQGILCGHFYGKLAEQVERQLGIASAEIKGIPFWYQVGDTLADVCFLILVNGGCLLLHVVPAIGSLLGLIGSYYFTCMTLGLDYFDYPLSLRGKRRRDKRDFARQHRAVTLGLGTAVALITFVPLLNAVLLTTAVTGAVLLHRRLAATAGGTT